MMLNLNALLIHVNQDLSYLRVYIFKTPFRKKNHKQQTGGHFLALPTVKIIQLKHHSAILD